MWQSARRHRQSATAADGPAWQSPSRAPAADCGRAASAGFEFNLLPLRPSPRSQPKLTVGGADTPLERDADRVAETVLNMPRPSAAGSGSAHVSDAPRTVAREAAEPGSSSPGGFEAPSSVRDTLNSPGEPLDGATRAFFEPRMGFDFSRVRVHRDGGAARSADAIGASAYTFGNNIVLGGAHASTAADSRLMAHELAHVVQQSGAVSRQIQRKGKPGGHGIDYKRLLADKKLDIGVGIGVEFISEYNDIVTLLTGEGFTRGTASGGNAVFTKAVNMKIPGEEKKGAQKFTIVVELVNQNSAHPKDSMAGFFAQKDVALYSGHARYGTGPDFDAKDSQKENFVIGVNSKLHQKHKLTPGYDAHMNSLLKGRKNDLEQMSKNGKFDANRYQVWMFNACSSNQYLDEIRGGLVTDKTGHTKSSKNLRIFGTTHSIYSDCVPILKGLISLQSMDKIVATMDAKEKGEAKAHHEHVHKGYYFSN